MKKYLTPFLLLASLILTGCAGGGGGGGASGGTTYPTYTAADFQTAEYNAQSGLNLVKAASMYANTANCPANGGTNCRPYDGNGQKIAVADSGINPVEASTGSSISIDSANSYNYVDNASGSSSDPNGHGTHVSGIIAAPKNNLGMHGIAPGAQLLNLRIADASGNISLSDSQWANLSTRSLSAGAYISNNSWGSSAAITSVSEATIRASNPLTISEYQNYVANGGVVVFAAGNDYAVQPSIQAGLPYRISGLEAGWLAVMAVNPSGNETLYTNRCGVAKAWCLAAPGGGDNQSTEGIYSMYNDGGYTRMSGTSMAAPMVSGALAALKNTFPNLSYQQVRDRLLLTANKTGQYANQDIFGQGLMDLQAASSPIGGLSLPTGLHTSGSLGQVPNSKIILPSSIANSMQGAKVLLVDNYQKAPFLVSASSFVQESKIQSNFASRHMNSMAEPAPIDIEPGDGIKLSQLQGLHSSLALSQFGHTFAFSSGIKSEQSLTRQLGLPFTPHLNDSGTNTNGFGYATKLGKTKIAFLSSAPNTQSAFNPSELNQDRSSMGSRTAYSIVSQREHENFSYGIAYSSANSFSQPLGISASGAFGLSNTQASSLGSFYSHTLFSGTTKLKAGFEIANMNATSMGLTSFDSGKYSVFRIGGDHFLNKQTVLSINFKQEQALSGQLMTRLPSSIDESGNIGYQNYQSGFSNLINSNAVNLDIHHKLDAASRIKAGIMYEQKPYGLNGAGVAFFYQHRL